MDIANEIFESYLQCKYKAFLKLKGESGDRTEYEELQLELREEQRKKAVEKITKGCEEYEVLWEISGSIRDLEKGYKIVLNPSIEHRGNKFSCDALERVEGKSALGDFHYIPMLVRENNKLDKESKMIVTLDCITLGEIQGIQPEFGKIVYGEQLTTTKVKTETNQKETQKAIQEIEKIENDDYEPRFIMN